MTCKNCYHYEVCSKKDGTTDYYGKEIACSNVDELCEYFKNKSLIVELPYSACEWLENQLMQAVMISIKHQRCELVRLPRIVGGIGMTNYEKYKMSVEEMAELLNHATSQLALKLNGKYVLNTTEAICDWLESEVEE